VAKKKLNDHAIYVRTVIKNAEEKAQLFNQGASKKVVVEYLEEYVTQVNESFQASDFDFW
jgi:hypothetical protein